MGESGVCRVKWKKYRFARPPVLRHFPRSRVPPFFDSRSPALEVSFAPDVGLISYTIPARRKRATEIALSMLKVSLRRCFALKKFRRAQSAPLPRITDPTVTSMRDGEFQVFSVVIGILSKSAVFLAVANKTSCLAELGVPPIECGTS